LDLKKIFEISFLSSVTVNKIQKFSELKGEASAKIIQWFSGIAT
jgi:hypothetical protein